MGVRMEGGGGGGGGRRRRKRSSPVIGYQAIPRYGTASPFKGHLSTKSNAFCIDDSSRRLSNQYLIRDHMASHYNKILSAKAAVDSSAPKSRLNSIKLSDQQRREKLKKETERPEQEAASSSNNVSRSSSRESRRPLSATYTKNRREGLQNKKRYHHEEMGQKRERDSGSHFKDSQEAERNVRLSPCAQNEEMHASGSSSTPEKQNMDFPWLERKCTRKDAQKAPNISESSSNSSTSSLQRLHASTRPRKAQNAECKIRSGDLLDKHSDHFTGGQQPFTPRTLKSDAQSFLAQYRYYTPVKRKVKQVDAQTQTDRCPPETPGTQLGTAGDRPAPVTYLRLRTRAAVDGIQRNPMVGDRGAACDDRIQPHRVPSLVQVEGAQAGLLQVGGAPAGGQPFPVAAPPLRDHGEAIGLQAAALQGSAPDSFQVRSRISETMNVADYQLITPQTDDDSDNICVPGGIKVVSLFPTLRVALPGIEPTPLRRRLQAEEEELLYLNFIQDITDEILRLGVYSNRALDRLFERNIEQNRNRLNEVKMRRLLNILKADLGCTRDESTEDEESDSFDLLENQPLKQRNLPRGFQRRLKQTPESEEFLKAMALITNELALCGENVHKAKGEEEFPKPLSKSVSVDLEPSCSSSSSSSSSSRETGKTPETPHALSPTFSSPTCDTDFEKCKPNELQESSAESCHISADNADQHTA